MRARMPLVVSGALSLLMMLGRVAAAATATIADEITVDEASGS